MHFEMESATNAEATKAWVTFLDLYSPNPQAYERLLWEKLHCGIRR